MLKQRMMKIKDILYVVAALLLAACAGDETVATGDGTLSGHGKTPLLINATLGTGSGTAITRAAGKKFEANDELLVYLRHTTSTTKTGNPLAYPVTDADQAPRLVKLTMNADAVASSGNVTETSNFTATYTGTGGPVTNLYWDDFSNSASADTDLRTEHHGLQSFYGYCYNGGTPTKGLTDNSHTEADGIIEWTIQDDQTPVETGTGKALNLQHSDLLWSGEQNPVVYEHASTHTGDHHTLTIPYTHAMSQITVKLIAADGFKADDYATILQKTALTLNKMNTVTTLTAPAGTFSPATATDETNIKPVKMHKGSPAKETISGETYATCDFTAIVAPGTKLKVDEKLLDIVDVEDNNYTVSVTTSMLTATAWANTLSETVTVVKTTDTDSKEYLVTQPGVNYHLDVTVKKTEVQTRATLADWKTVSASGAGSIVYQDDENGDWVMDDTEIPTGKNGMNVTVVDKDDFKNGASFSLFTLKSDGTNNDEANERINENYTFATFSTYNITDDTADNNEWVNNPKLYWPNKTDNYYFRALAQFNSIAGTLNDISKVGVTGESTLDKAEAIKVQQGTIAQGRDILWGTTAKHKGKATTANPTGKPYGRGQAIPPRTGDVPIAFEHAMSKLTIKLETTADATSTMYNEKVNITGASISISNLYTKGKVTIESGEIAKTDADMTATNAITSTTTTVQPASGTIPADISGQRETAVNELIVIPQDISDDAKITITLNDDTDPNKQTTYTLKLKDCVVAGSSSKIGKWERGKHYVYTITLKKEQITFRALIKDWEEVTGSGNANLEWD